MHKINIGMGGVHGNQLASKSVPPWGYLWTQTLWVRGEGVHNLVKLLWGGGWVIFSSFFKCRFRMVSLQLYQLPAAIRGEYIRAMGLQRGWLAHSSSLATAVISTPPSFILIFLLPMRGSCTLLCFSVIYS